jgi:preprotein translocase subunit SecE
MNKIIAFWEDLKKEMAKVSWPTLPELRESTVVVVMYSIVVSILIFAIDKVYSSILGFLYQ